MYIHICVCICYFFWVLTTGSIESVPGRINQVKYICQRPGVFLVVNQWIDGHRFHKDFMISYRSCRSKRTNLLPMDQYHRMVCMTDVIDRHYRYRSFDKLYQGMVLSKEKLRLVQLDLFNSYFLVTVSLLVDISKIIHILWRKNFSTGFSFSGTLATHTKV
jgi:hypothetical protein